MASLTAMRLDDDHLGAVHQIVTRASDRSSDSTDMITAATGWAQRYHLDPARANILRSLDLPATARVLEIGAGCGALTRYLGERCAHVDALEACPEQAAVARVRTADLTGVAIIVGDLADLPGTANYDVVVLVDLPAEPLDLLAAISSRLVDGGTLICAATNPLGVKYLCGAPTDDTHRPWDSVERSPEHGDTAALARRHLEDEMARAGLQPSVRVAFPDHHLTRAVLGDFPAGARSLLHRIPAFPSPDRHGPRPRLCDERSLWRQLVRADLAGDFGNSFLVLAGKGAPSRLWPERRLGVFFSMGRPRPLEVRTDVDLADDTVYLTRSARSEHAQPDGVRVVPSRVPFVPGVDLVDVLAESGVGAFAQYSDKWLAMLDRAIVADPTSVADLVPHNLVVDKRGELQQIDLEFTNCRMSRDQVVRRGIYNLADRIAPLAAPSRWAPATTVRDLMIELGQQVGLPTDGSWIERTLTEEEEFYATVRLTPNTTEGLARWHRRSAALLRANVSRRLDSLPLGERAWNEQSQLEAALATAKNELRTARRENDQLRAKLVNAQNARTQADHAARKLTRSPEVRVLRRARRLLRSRARSRA